MENRDEILGLVSVIILSYQKFDYLFEAINSVFCQNYPSIELIIADDASHNFPNNEIHSYIQHNKRTNISNYCIIHRVKNIGTVRNYNGAIAKAKGEYVFPLACDDVFYNENVITDIVEYFIKRGCVSLCTRRVVCDNRLTPLYFSPQSINVGKICRLSLKGELRDKFLVGQSYEFAAGASLYFRKDFLKQIGCFDEKYCLWEDGPMLLKLLEMDKLAIEYNMITIKYRLGGISTYGVVHPRIRLDGNEFLRTNYDLYLYKFKHKSDKELWEYYFQKLEAGENGINKKIWALKHAIPACGTIVYKIRMRIGKVIDNVLYINHL